MEMEAEEVDEEVDNNKASTLKQMQEIVLKVQVEFDVDILPESNQYLRKAWVGLQASWRVSRTRLTSARRLF